MKKVIINVDMYDEKVIVCFDRKDLPNVISEEEEGEYYYFSHKNIHYVLCTNKCGITPSFIQCLSHELNHVAMCILYERGVGFGYEEQETLCYMQDFLMRKVLDKVMPVK